MLVSLLESNWNTTKENEWYKSTVYETLRSLYSEHEKQIILDRPTARKEVQVGKGQEKAQSEKDSKNRGGKKPN